jgi:hypothetical protein
MKKIGGFPSITAGCSLKKVLYKFRTNVLSSLKYFICLIIDTIKNVI